MHQEILSSGRDTLLVAVPLLALLIIGFFRLDETIAMPKRSARRKPGFCGMGNDGQPVFTDPDGRIRLPR